MTKRKFEISKRTRVSTHEELIAKTSGTQRESTQAVRKDLLQSVSHWRSQLEEIISTRVKQMKGLSK